MGRRYRRRTRHGGFRRRHRDYRRRKHNGWGMGLYRNTRDGKVAGVCAGLADHWDIAHWVMRLIWIGGFIFTGTLALWVYLGAWILLSPRPTRRREDGGYGWDEPEYEEVEVEMEYDERHHDYRPRKVFRYTEASSVRLNRARDRLDAALRRVEDMESYVTSRKFKLNREFSKL